MVTEPSLLHPLFRSSSEQFLREGPMQAFGQCLVLACYWELSGLSVEGEPLHEESVGSILCCSG